jgi:hypothetical protein
MINQSENLLSLILKLFKPGEEFFFPAKKGMYLLIRKIIGTSPRRFNTVKAIATEAIRLYSKNDIHKALS